MLRVVLIVLTVALASGAENPVFAQKTVISAKGQQLTDQIVTELQLAELARILADEAMVDAETQLDPALDPGARREWLSNLRRLNDAERLLSMLSDALSRAGASAPEAELLRALDFYRKPLGKRVVALELSARRAMIDPDGRSAAEAAYVQSGREAAARRQKLEQLIDASDVIEASVASGLNAYLAATRGFQAAVGENGTEADLVDVWAQEDQIRHEVGNWVRGLLFLAYGPLSDAELEQLIAFTKSSEGQILADVVLQAFDEVFMQVAFETGMASAASIAGEEL